MVLFLLAGLILLVVGGELLVRGASKVAGHFGISPLVIGLTVVAFGTSAPELAVSVQAGLSGSSDIAIGNVVGSNIFNVLFILGVCSLILPLGVSLQVVRREVPIMIGVSLLLFVLALDGEVSLADGLLLFAGIVVYTVWSLLASRKAAAAMDGGHSASALPIENVEPSWIVASCAAFAVAVGGLFLGMIDAVVAGLMGVGASSFLVGAVFGKAASKRGDLVRQLGLVLGGLGILVWGAGLLIEGSVSLARALGISDLIIGLTIISAGTSLPEVATSIIATIRKERDIAVGNVVGSNIFNILSILGISAIVTPGGLSVSPQMIGFDIPIMMGVALASLPIFFTGSSIVRWEGALFLASYCAYTCFLVLIATGHPALGTFRSAMLVALPLVVLVLAWSVFQALRARKDSSSQLSGKPSEKR